MQSVDRDQQDVSGRSLVSPRGLRRDHDAGKPERCKHGNKT
jgi:hypothetical protein